LFITLSEPEERRTEKIMAAKSTATRSRYETGSSADALARYLSEIGGRGLLTAAEEVELARAIEAGTRAASRLDSGAPTSDIEATRLARLVRNGVEAKERFVSANLRLVVANARRYAGAGGLDMLDLIQEGNLGLIRAVEKFDWRKGFKFSTYATWWIRQAIARAIASQSRTVRIPVHLHEVLGTVKSAAASLTGSLGRVPTEAEVAAETGIPEQRVKEALEVVETISLDKPVGEDGAFLGEFVLDADGLDPQEETARAEAGRALRSALGSLPPRQAAVLDARFGLSDGRARPLAEIGAELGLTPERVRQIVDEALESLRMDSPGLADADVA
jgi:RNA polymerase primary sigma factor